LTGVDRIILGCGNFGGVGSDLSLVGQGDSDDEAFALMDAAWAHGVTRFDTASSYGGGRSERAIGKWIATRRPDGLALTSKVFHPVRDGDDSGLGAERVRRVVHQSLAQLGVERIDLYLIHEPDPATPLAQTLAVLDALVAEGVLGAIGVSKFDGSHLVEAISLTRVAAVQNEYSLLVREAEREVLPLCVERGIEFQCFSPLAGGWLTGKYRRDEPFPAGSRMTLLPAEYEGFVREEVFDRLDELEARAAARGVEPAALALAWLLSSPDVGAVVVGPRRPSQLETVWTALALDLDDGERAELSEVFA
jgi:aryl-alcohol dehydrogenase-like predicted oxidoreductase